MSKDNINFKYVFQDNYEPSYINGAFGGTLPTGEIVVNFFLERPPIPYEESFHVNEDGTLQESPEYIKPDEYKIRRTIKCGIIMSPENAASIHSWLGERLADLEDSNSDG